MSLLTIIAGDGNVCDRLGIQRPTAVAANTDLTIRQLLGFAQEEGDALARAYVWQALTTETTFVTLAQESQTGAIPADFDYYINDSMFNRSSRRRVTGPLSSEEWQVTKATLVTLVNPAFRMRGDAILITPTPAAGETMAYEYASKNWCRSNMSVGQTAWAADADTAVLDEKLHILGIIWRWKKSKGLDYSEEMQNYEIQKAQAILRDGGRPRISADGAPRERVPMAPQTPETLTVF